MEDVLKTGPEVAEVDGTVLLSAATRLIIR